MTTNTPLVIVSGQPRQLASGNKLGGITGGTATGEAMTQDQFGSNSSQMTTSGVPTFNNITATTLIDSPLWSHAGHMDITPTSGHNIDLNVAGASGGLRVLSTDADAISFDRSSNTDSGTTISYSTASSAKWSFGPASGSENLRIFNTTAGLNSISIDGTTGIPTLLTPILGTPTSGTLSNCTGLPISSGVSGLGTGVATALAVNTGSSGAFVVNGGALGTPSSGTVTNLTGTASININGTVGATTPAAGTFTTLASTGATTLGDASGDTVTFNADAWTFPTSVTITRTAAASTAEEIFRMTVSDNTSSFIRFLSNSSTDANFAPAVEGFHSGANVAYAQIGTITTDTGTNPCASITARVTGSPNTDVATRPLFQVVNRATILSSFTATYNIGLKGPATSPASEAAAADTVWLSPVDKAAGDRRLSIQAELGSAITLGNDRLNFAASTGLLSIAGTDLLSMTATTMTVSSTTDSTSSSTGAEICSGGRVTTKNQLALQGQGWGVTSTATAAGTTTLSSTSKIIQIFTGSTTQTVTLPAANLFGSGIAVVFIIKNRSSGTVTINRAGSDTIDGGTSTTLTGGSNQSVTLVSDGSTAWVIV